MAKLNLNNEILKSFPENKKVIGVPGVFIGLTGNHATATVLAQLVYWQGTKPGEWFWKTDYDLAKECYLSLKQVQRIRDRLEECGVKSRRMGNPAKMHYFVNTGELSAAIARYLGLGNGQPTGQNDRTETEVYSDNMTEQDTTICPNKLVLKCPNSSIDTKSTSENTSLEAAGAADVDVIFQDKEISKTPTRSKHPKTHLPQSTPAGLKGNEAQPVKDARVDVIVASYQRVLKEKYKVSTAADNKIRGKILNALPMYEQQLDKVEGYITWLCENWLAISDTDDLLKNYRSPPLHTLTSAHFFNKYFTQYEKGQKVKRPFDANKLANERAAKAREEGQLFEVDMEGL